MIYGIIIHSKILQGCILPKYKALSTRIRFLFFLSVFKKIHVLTENDVFEKFHFGERLRKVPFLALAFLALSGTTLIDLAVYVRVDR